MPGFDVKQIKRNDQVILGAGILFLLLSFFAPFYGVSYHGGGFGGSASVTAWHSYGFLAVLLIVIAVAIVAARVLGNASLPALPIGPNLLVVVSRAWSSDPAARLHLQVGHWRWLLSRP